MSSRLVWLWPILTWAACATPQERVAPGLEPPPDAAPRSPTPTGTGRDAPPASAPADATPAVVTPAPDPAVVVNPTPERPSDAASADISPSAPSMGAGPLYPSARTPVERDPGRDGDGEFADAWPETTPVNLKGTTIAKGKYPYAAETMPGADVPRGTLTPMDAPLLLMSASKGTTYKYFVHVPKAYDPKRPAALMIWLEAGLTLWAGQLKVPEVTDTLIHRGEMPVTINVFLDMPQPTCGSMDDLIVKDLLPEIRKRYNVTEGSHGIMGWSHCGAFALRLAFRQPAVFNRVYTISGGYRTVDGFPDLVKAPPMRPHQRTFLVSSTNEYPHTGGDPHWGVLTQRTGEALRAGGYHNRTVMGNGGHSVTHGNWITPNALRYLWRGLEVRP